MGESPSARTQLELADLRSAIDRDVDEVIARVKRDVNPCDLVRRQPLAVLGSAASMATAAAVGIVAKRRAKEQERVQLDVLAERVGGRLGKLKGDARKRFRKELQKELAEVEKTGPREALWGAIAAALTTLATDVAQRLGRRVLGDERVDTYETSGRSAPRG